MLVKHYALQLHWITKQVNYFFFFFFLINFGVGVARGALLERITCHRNRDNEVYENYDGLKSQAYFKGERVSAVFSTLLTFGVTVGCRFTLTAGNMRCTLLSIGSNFDRVRIWTTDAVAISTPMLPEAYRAIDALLKNYASLARPRREVAQQIKAVLTLYSLERRE